MHQYLFFIGDFPIRAYGTMLALAIICGASVAYVLLKKDGRGWHEHIIDFSITVAVAGLIGARLWDVFFFDWDYYGNHLLEIPLVWQGGMAIQGGVVLGTIAGYWYLRKNNIDFWSSYFQFFDTCHKIYNYNDRNNKCWTDKHISSL